MYPKKGCDPVGKSTPEQVPTRPCRPMEGIAHAEAGCLVGLVNLREPMLEQCVSEALQPMGETCAGAACEKLSSRGGMPCWNRETI